MGSPSVLRIAKVLRATLQCVEESGIAPADSSELIQLKQHVVRAVSELELQKSPAKLEPQNQPGGKPEPEMPLVILRMR
jgi:hypothetical protein